MKREIIKIDDEKCNGCGLCIPNCQEGALKIIDGKCRLVSELFCDGLGACIGYCPEGALTIELRDAEEYNEVEVLKIMLKQSMNVVSEHLRHLKEHNAIEYYSQAINYLKDNHIDIPIHLGTKSNTNQGCSCPGAQEVSIRHNQEPNRGEEILDNSTDLQSKLEQWPIQLHLVNPFSPYFHNKDLVIAATCSGFADANIHRDYIKNNALIIACPKLDVTDPYTDKLKAIIDNCLINKIIVLKMEVPCCTGLTKITLSAKSRSQKSDLIIEEHTLSLNGKIIGEKIVSG